MSAQTIDQGAFVAALGTLMREAYLGPDDPNATWFADNEPDCGIVGMLEQVDAEQASIASHANHVRYALNLVNRAVAGEDAHANGAMGVVAHRAWHLGAIRQLVALVTGD